MGLTLRTNAVDRERRRILTATGVALLTGCLSSASDSDGEGIVARKLDNDGTAEPAEFHYALEDEGLTVTRLTVDDGVLAVTIESTAKSPGQRHAEMGTIAAVFSDYVQNGGTDERVAVIYHGPGSEERSEYAIKRAWVEAYAAGELTDRGLLNHIQDTLVQGESPATER